MIDQIVGTFELSSRLGMIAERNQAERLNDIGSAVVLQKLELCLMVSGLTRTGYIP